MRVEAPKLREKPVGLTVPVAGDGRQRIDAIHEYVEGAIRERAVRYSDSRLAAEGRHRPEVTKRGPEGPLFTPQYEIRRGSGMR